MSHTVASCRFSRPMACLLSPFGRSSASRPSTSFRQLGSSSCRGAARGGSRARPASNHRGPRAEVWSPSTSPGPLAPRLLNHLAAVESVRPLRPPDHFSGVDATAAERPLQSLRTRQQDQILWSVIRLIAGDVPDGLTRVKWTAGGAPSRRGVPVYRLHPVPPSRRRSHPDQAESCDSRPLLHRPPRAHA